MTEDTEMPGLRLVRAPNPSAMTFLGTNTWIVGRGTVAVIDPGPADARHLAAILGALGPGERVSHVLVTHAHLDHSALAPALGATTGAPVLAFGTVRDGLRPGRGGFGGGGSGDGGGAGIDAAFVPDRRLADGETVEGPGWRLEAIHTPGHLGNHLCFGWGSACFTGDHVMGWSTSIVSPPEGSMGDYMASLARIAARRWSVFLPGHGENIADPPARLAGLAAHRRAREAAILAAIDGGAADVAAVTARVYHDLTPDLRPAAERNVLAHLIDLHERNLVAAAPGPTVRARYGRP